MFISASFDFLAGHEITPCLTFAELTSHSGKRCLLTACFIGRFRQLQPRLSLDKMQKSRAGSPPSPRIPAPPKTNRSSKKRHGRPRDRDRAYSLPRSKSRRSEVTLTLCVFHTTSHNWSTEPFRFDPNRTNDRELWTDIRNTFRMDLQKPWRRVFGFKKVKSIVPIAVYNCSWIIFFCQTTVH